MPIDETAFVARIRDQIRFLQLEEYNYNELLWNRRAMGVRTGP